MTTAFISYTHRDETFRQELETHLAPFKRQGLISVWHDRRLTPGDAFDEVISDNMKNADLILLLISSDFIASDYCYSKEMTLALERHRAGQARAISIVCRPCHFDELPFAKCVLLPTDAKPVSTWNDRDAAWVDVVAGIRKALSAPPATSAGRQTNPISPARAPLPRVVSDLDRDRFFQNCQRDIPLYFRKELDMLEMRDPNWKGVFQEIDATRFKANVYVAGREVAACKVFPAGVGMPRTICYSENVDTGGSSWNESLRVEADENGPFLKPAGMPMSFSSSISRRMEPFDAAAYLVELMMHQARRRIS